jgi:lysophospholipase L1-like esterase
MIGNVPPDWADNLKRKEFNDHIRAHFDANHLFDIAKLEAETVKGPDGKEVEVLRSDLTSDGGHLNDKGKRVVAAAFLKMIAAEPVGH